MSRLWIEAHALFHMATDGNLRVQSCGVGSQRPLAHSV
jgi:hypothetical protein